MCTLTIFHQNNFAVWIIIPNFAPKKNCLRAQFAKHLLTNYGNNYKSFFYVFVKAGCMLPRSGEEGMCLYVSRYCKAKINKIYITILIFTN